MGEIFERVGDRLAAHTSRRGFLATVAKSAMALGAVTLGLTQSREALAYIGPCCTGLCPGDPEECPSGTTEGNNPYCCHNSDGYYTCVPCVTGGGSVQCYIWAGPSGTCQLDRR